MAIAIMHLLKRDIPHGGVTIEHQIDERDTAFSGVRCPQCGWRPTSESRWACVWDGEPEPRFDSCGAVWNTFATAGRCPGCSHQWQWTSCLRCAQWSPHLDWYEDMPEA